LVGELACHVSMTEYRATDMLADALS
jgi:hypothetical protein